ncbi:MAG: hypothetical protein ACKOFO_11480 [Gemmatimonadota bacterium]
MPLRRRRTITCLTLAVGLALAYLALWPVPIDPVAWDAPTDRGFVGDFAVESSLAGAERIPLGDHPGPESVARDGRGRRRDRPRSRRVAPLPRSRAPSPAPWCRQRGARGSHRPHRACRPCRRRARVVAPQCAPKP